MAADSVQSWQCHGDPQDLTVLRAIAERTTAAVQYLLESTEQIISLDLGQEHLYLTQPTLLEHLTSMCATSRGHQKFPAAILSADMTVANFLESSSRCTLGVQGFRHCGTTNVRL